MPILEKITFNFGSKLPNQKSIPTVDNPKWTGSFDDDTEVILLRAVYGEAGGESKEAKIAVAWAIRNRVEDSKHRWGITYHEVILAKYQYEPFSDPESKIFEHIANPSLDEEGELKAWQGSFEVAKEVIQGEVSDPTKGANHFYVPSDQPKQDWVDEKKFTVQIGTTRFYKL